MSFGDSSWEIPPDMKMEAVRVSGVKLGICVGMGDKDDRLSTTVLIKFESNGQSRDLDQYVVSAEVAEEMAYGLFMAAKEARDNHG